MLGVRLAGLQATLDDKSQPYDKRLGLAGLRCELVVVGYDRIVELVTRGR